MSLDAQETFLIIIIVKKKLCCSIFLWKCNLWWIEISKEQHLFEMEIFFSNINVLKSVYKNDFGRIMWHWRLE